MATAEEVAEGLRRNRTGGGGNAADKVVATLKRNRSVWSLRRQMTQTVQDVKVTLPAQIASYGDPALAPLGTELATHTDEFDTTTLSSMWSQLNWGTTSYSFLSKRLLWSTQPSGGAGTQAVRGLITPVPTGSWVIRTRVANYSTAINLGGGLLAYRTGGTLLTHHSFVRVIVTTTPYAEQWAGTYWASVSSPTLNPYGAFNNDVGRRDNFFQMRYDGTTLYMDFSPDNVWYANVGTVSAATALGGAPTHFGMSSNTPSVATPTLLGFDFFRTYSGANLQQTG